jgi:hypothetical protein
MSYRKLVILIVSVLYACLGSLVLLNVVVDPYEIFRTHFFTKQFQRNDRYSKIELLKTQKRKYDSYIIGSSRMANTSPALLAKYLPGAKVYNLSTIAATPWEHLMHLKYLIQQKYSVKNVYIGLDIDFCLQVKMHNEKDLLSQLHPEVLNRSLIGYYWFYASAFPRKDIGRQLKLNFLGGKSAIPSSGDDGALSEEDFEKAELFFEDPLKDKGKEIKNEVKDGNVESVKELVALCRQREISLILFITPHSEFFMDRFIPKDYLTCLTELSYITSFWDFSGYNSVTTHRNNYWDASHYKSSVSRMIAARIFNDTGVSVPEDFGAWVTKDNISDRLKTLREEFSKRRATYGK